MKKKLDISDYHKNLLDWLDDLMIALSKQSKLRLNTDVVIALKGLTKARNAFKEQGMIIDNDSCIPIIVIPKEAKKTKVFTYMQKITFLDQVVDAL